MKKEICFRKELVSTVLTLSMFSLFVSCASNQPVVLSTVGPKSAPRRLTEGQGYLVVYSDTEPVPQDEGISYYIHTSYLIRTPQGRTVKWVANHVGDMDETPQVVPLPAGTYHVLAQSTDYGRVSVPVVIAPRQTTKLHLEGKGSWRPQPLPKHDDELVRFPDGEPVGWHELAGN
jgi:hypothetical protein